MAKPVFLSYSWDDMSEVDELDARLRLRGIPVWRDRRGMRWGGYNEDVVRQAISDQVSGFALYLTPAALHDSWFIPQVELRAMDERRSHAAPFFSGAIFRGYEVDTGKREVFDATGIDIGSTLGTVVEENDLEGGWRRASNELLRSYLLSEWESGPAIARVETRDEIPVEDASLLHLGVCPPLDHDPDDYDAAVWSEEIQPALDDLQHALHSAQTRNGGRERILDIRGRLHLSAALAVGHAFREPTGWQLRLHHHDDIWESRREPGSLEGWDCSSHAGSDPAGDIVVMVHITADVTTAARASAGGPARAELHFRPPSGPDKFSLNPSSANSVAAAIAKSLRQARESYSPSETRLYLASPWPFAALLGWHLASVGPVVMHEATVDRDSYRVSCVFR